MTAAQQSTFAAMRPALPRLALAVFLGVLALVSLTAPSGAQAKAQHWTNYTRPATYAVTTDNQVPITMSDGTVLRARVDRPDSPKRFPVVVVQTPYNKDGGINIALGGASTYLVQRGYAVVTVDVRGTGSSEGEWDSFGRSEQTDGKTVINWAAKQSWSNGRVGVYGPSYMGITAVLTAARRPKALKAAFPIVPMADGYRDIVFSGGQLNISFIPLWLGLVTAGGLTPPTAVPNDPADLLNFLTGSLNALVSHIEGVVNFQASTVLDASTGGDSAFDGPFWKRRSPLEQVDKIRVPTFVVGGHHDLFQRGEPLIYERLKHHVPTRLLMGPWTHLGGSTGQGLPRDGVPSVNDIALRWFDRYLKGKKRATKVGKIPQVTQYVYGPNKYRTQRDWPDPRLQPKRFFLSGNRHKRGKGSKKTQSFLQEPLSGICSQSTSQWSAGLTEALPCTTDDRLNELGQAVYSTKPMKHTLKLSGPMMARIWATTTASDAVLAVRVTDVAPDGKSTELTTGWLAGSFRKVNRKRSRIYKHKMLQPWHPFTRASVKNVPANKPINMPVEIFPARASIQKGHRLRIVVGPGDFPHQIPPLGQALSSLAGQVKILTTKRHRSYLTVSSLGKHCARKGCKRLKTPRLIRGN